MAEKKIVVDIDETGEIKAETFGMQGTECLEDLDKLLKDLALQTEVVKKAEFYKERTTADATVTAKKV